MNAASLFIVVLVVALAILDIRVLVRNRRKGKKCGNGCGSCSMKSSCKSNR